MKISQKFSELLRGCSLYTEISKGHNSVNSVGDSVLCLYQVLSIYNVSHRVSELRT